MRHTIFKKTIWSYYKTAGRAFPWRKTKNPYDILVSEIMLQQTQVSRVVKKYLGFLALFPTITALSCTRQSSVLAAWQGLGYNRRALYLHRAARKIMRDYSGKVPKDPAKLLELPGIGKETAGAIRAFAFNEPSIFIETNIRRVFIHFFFRNKTEISDSILRTQVEITMDRRNPREWYYALMDYGAMLAASARENPNRRSKGYIKQSKFTGSNRELRGKILRLFLKRKSGLQASEIAHSLSEKEKRVRLILIELNKEGFIRKKSQNYALVN